MKASLLLALLVAGHAFAYDPRIALLVQQADLADARQEPQVALPLLQQAEAIEPANFGVVLRISKVSSDLADRAKNKAASKAIAERALTYGKRAAALDPKNAKAQLNLAVCYGKLTDFVENREKVEYARRIHEAVGLSLQLDPNDDYGWHVLGRWHYGVANLNGVIKAVAGFMYGGLPAASNDEAIRCFKKAVELAPQRIMHHAELARVYAAADKPERAAQEWQNVLGIRPVGAADERYQKEAKLALEAAKLPRSTGGRGVAIRR